MPRLSSAILAGAHVVFMAAGACADVSAEDVWSDWQSYIQSFGYEIDGNLQRESGSLVVTGATVKTKQQEEAGGFSLVVDRMVLTEQPDGTVRISLPAVMPAIMSTPQPDAGTTRMSMDYRLNGMDIVAAGTPDALEYKFAAEAVSLETTGIEVDGKLLPQDDNAVSFVLEDLRGTAQTQQGESFRVSQDFEAETARYKILSSDQETGARSEIVGQTRALEFTGQSTLPSDTGLAATMTDLLEAGMRSAGTFTYASNAMTLLVTTPGGTSDAALYSDAGSFDVSVNEAGVSYRARQDDLRAEINSDRVGLPLSFSVAESAFNLTMPLRKTDAPEDFAFGLKLSDFSMPEVLWGLFDPDAQLPRDPASVVLDLAGKARLLFDFLDPGDAAALSPETPPVEIENVDIRQLRIAAVGAELDGNGAFSFDTGETGVPKPTGAVDLTLTGGNALIDKLIATGLLPEQQAMGVRMMMGLLAAPGAAPDTLTSRIEVNDQGHILANGQRIQ